MSRDEASTVARHGLDGGTRCPVSSSHALLISPPVRTRLSSPPSVLLLDQDFSKQAMLGVVRRG